MKFQLKCLKTEFYISEYTAKLHNGWMKFSLEIKFSIGPSDKRYKCILKLNIVIWSATVACRLVV